MCDQPIGGEMEKRQRCFTLGYYCCCSVVPGLRHFSPFSPAWPLKRCCDRLSAAASLMGDVLPPFSRRLSLPPRSFRTLSLFLSLSVSVPSGRPRAIPFILISRSYACTCHLLSLPCDRCRFSRCLSRYPDIAFYLVINRSRFDESMILER